MEKDEDGHYFNNTFKGLEGVSNLNACVGNNGFPDLPHYAQGFLDAAYTLGELVTLNNIEYSVDEFIYPIAFNLRHSVELWLMHFTQCLRGIRSADLYGICPKDGSRFRLTQKHMEKTHNIVTLWEWWLINSQERDSRLVQINEQLKEYVEDISAIDPTGQTFRYPYSTEEEKHLVKTPIINIYNLTARIGEVRILLNELNHLLKELVGEYDLCTYTKTLSRAEISLISKSIPPINRWKEQVFKEVKSEIKEIYKIGNAEFSTALDIIKSHRTFAHNIGINFDLKAATFEDLHVFLDAWLLYHPDIMKKRLENDYEKPISSFVSGKDIDANELYEGMIRRAKIVKEVYDKLGIAAQADFSTLFYLARYNNYCENYDWIYDRELNELTHAQNNKSDAVEFLKHVLEKPNYIQNLSNSLIILSQDILLQNLKKHYEGRIIFDVDIV
ncbi:hypothetical protein [Pseudoalteromonas translucida]|uniref:Orphan protein n=1 Tax=Pseudoalteromonas translucida (strain TAC 125) TaxID=326442 RepID=Q3II00_PSET1|nr:hypothetical protein [Pseudoalteromonas translucida]CAI87398.1 putative orphan protein [Pseudoalteromonas translucida]